MKYRETSAYAESQTWRKIDEYKEELVELLELMTKTGYIRRPLSSGAGVTVGMNGKCSQRH